MKTLVLSLLILLFSAGIAYARLPNPADAVENCQNRCAEVAKDCSKGCDRAHATKEEIANCIHNCAKESANCHVQCTLFMKECAKEFQECIRKAKGDEKAREGCIKGFHHCKGTD